MISLFPVTLLVWDLSGLFLLILLLDFGLRWGKIKKMFFPTIYSSNNNNKRVAYYFYCGLFHKLELDTIINPSELIPENARYTRFQKAWRRLLVYSIFALSLGASAAINFGLTHLQGYLNNAYPSSDSTVGYLVSLLTGIVVAVENIIWSLFCMILTDLEVYETWDSYRIMYGGKIIFWKLANITILYYWISLVLNDNKVCSGISASAGRQFIINLAVDLFCKKLPSFSKI